MSSSRPRVGLGQLTAVFAALAEEHAKRRGGLEQAQTWRQIQQRLSSAEDEWQRPSLFGVFRMLLPAAAVAAVVVGAIALLIPARLHYEVHGGSVAYGSIRSVERPASIDFSDGSQIQMQKGSATRVEILGAHAASTRLTTGQLEVRVRHAADTDYRFVAGPYEVRVIGTAFRLSWQPESKSFELVMREGRVRVLGPDQLDRALVAGETLRVTRDADRLASAPSEQSRRADSVTPAVPRELGPAADVEATRTAAPEESRTRGLGKAEESSWPALVAKGRFSEVVEAAEAIGAERVVRERSAVELSALSHAAHYTGHAALAIHSWTSLRERFPGQKSARQAAFFLGRLYDQQGRAADALRWLNAYLAESPRDVYASEALGRKLTVMRKLNGPTEARAVAEEYISRFPHGAYAQTARALLSE